MAIARAWLPDGFGVKAVRGTSCPRDGVSTVSCWNLEDMASCLDGTIAWLDRHAGRVARVVVQLLARRPLLRNSALDADIMGYNEVGRSNTGATVR
jgi:hypothetical protein